MGDNGGTPFSSHPGIQENLKFTAIKNPDPSSASFFIAEQGGTTTATTSIDDGYYAVDFSATGEKWRNVPASLHGNRGGLFLCRRSRRLNEVDKWENPIFARVRRPFR